MPLEARPVYCTYMMLCTGYDAQRPSRGERGTREKAGERREEGRVKREKDKD